MKKILLLANIIFLPVFVYAQELGTLGGILKAFNKVVNSLIPIAFGIAVIAFFWGISKYISAAGSEESKDEGKRIMVGGIIALFILSSVWGIIAFFAKDLGINQDTKTIQVPLIGR